MTGARGVGHGNVLIHGWLHAQLRDHTGHLP